MKIVFFGTPLFAAHTLDQLIHHGCTISAVVTMPDRPKGRSGTPVAPPVKVLINKHSPLVPVLQPEKASDPVFIEELASFKADLFIVVAYGQILKQKVLDLPRLGSINVHASILPYYRGAAPIQRCIIDGNTEAGVTIMRMVRKMDAGDMLLVSKMPIPFEMTAGELEEGLCALGSKALLEVLPLIQSGTQKEIPQDEEAATFAPKVEQEDAELTWELDAKDVFNRYRGVTPRPGAWAWLSVRGVKKRLKIFHAEFVSDIHGVAGSLLEDPKKGLLVACAKSALRLVDIQLEGKKRVAARDFLNGIKRSDLSFYVPE